MRSNIFWILIFCGVLAVSAVAALVLRQIPASHARIYQDGFLIESLDLAVITEPYEITVSNENGFNIIEVERGRIRVNQADCRDGICTRQGWVSSGVTPIVCLPNRLVIRLEGSSGSDIDAVVG